MIESPTAIPTEAWLNMTTGRSAQHRATADQKGPVPIALVTV